jgi:NADH dehydrogenase
MGLFASLTLAAHAANNLIAALHNQPLKLLSYSYYGQGISLGPEDAVGYLTFPDDRPRGPVFRGKLAVSIRGFAVWLVASLLEIERRRPGSYVWLKGPRARKNHVSGQRNAANLRGQLDQ